MDFGALFYYLLLILWSGAVAYLVLFKGIPSLRKKEEIHNAHAAHTAHPKPPKVDLSIPEPRRSYSSHEGFKSFKTGDELSVDDIVKGLSKE